MKSLLITLGMFTKLPVPIVEWEEKKGPSAFIFFPFAGLVCGVFTYIIYLIVLYLNIYSALGSILLLLSLYLVCGFVHLDGFMDTADAFLASKDKDKTIEILKDSKVGAFSVISIVLLLIAQYISLQSALIFQLDPIYLLMVPILSRAFSVLVLFICKPLQTSGILYYFRDGLSRKHIVTASIILVVFISLFAYMKLLFALIFTGAVFLVTGFVIFAQKKLDGINGDIIGASIILLETLTYFAIPLIFNILYY